MSEMLHVWGKGEGVAELQGITTLYVHKFSNVKNNSKNNLENTFFDWRSF